MTDRHLRMTLHANEEMDDGDPEWTWAAIGIDLAAWGLIGVCAGVLLWRFS